VAGTIHKESGREVYLSGDQSDPFLDQFVSMMDDDLNTAGAIGLFFEKVREMNRLLDSEVGSLDEMIRSRLENDRHNLYLAARILGILHERPDQFFRQLAGDKSPVDRGTIKKMIEDRTAARASKDWQKADEIRERLKGMGIILEDGPQGTTWRLDVRNHH
jgi:cysteinyl-tRNA synthetase